MRMTSVGSSQPDKPSASFEASLREARQETHVRSPNCENRNNSHPLRKLRKSRHAWHFSSEPAVASTLTPNAFPSWIAVTPMPLDPPCNQEYLARSQTHPFEHVGPHRAEGFGQAPGVD